MEECLTGGESSRVMGDSVISAVAGGFGIWFGVRRGSWVAL